MSESAVGNLNDSLDLLSNTIEIILKQEAEFQKLLSQEIAGFENPKDFVLSYDKNDTMVFQENGIETPIGANRWWLETFVFAQAYADLYNGGNTELKLTR